MGSPVEPGLTPLAVDDLFERCGQRARTHTAAHICTGTGLTLLAVDDLFRRCGRQMTRNMRRGGRDTWRLTAET